MKYLLIFVLIHFFCNNIYANESTVVAHVLRLSPGEDPKLKLLSYAKIKNIRSASIVSAVGSLKVTMLRYANQKNITKLDGFREVLSLSGTFSKEDAHLHLSIADSSGATLGGHLAEGSQVYTTLEIVILTFPDLEFKRELDPKTTFPELMIKRISPL
jgi:predicted DNA-binding protein with PD1-like motif